MMKRPGLPALAAGLALGWAALGACLLHGSGAALAEGAVYRSVDEKGNVTYSDRPSPGGKRIQVAPVQTYAAPSPPGPNAEEPGTPEPSDTDGSAEAPVGYQEVTIISPVNDSVVRSNIGDVALGVRMVPELREGDTIAVLLDGKEIGEPSEATAQTLSNIERGTHVVSVQVRGPDGEELASSESITFHLQRATVRRGG